MKDKPGQRLVAWGSVGAVGVIALLISILLARITTRPIRRLTGVATAVERGQPFDPVDIADVTSGRDEISHLGRVFGRMVLTLRQREERIKHLNLVLRAVRNVNQLITREKDRDRLLRGACDNLIETRGYYSAWIALLDEAGGLVTAAEAGWGEDFVPLVEQLKRGELAACGQRALRQSEVVVIKDPASVCANCPPADKCSDRGVMVVRLEYGEKIYGLSSVSVPAGFIADEEERDLFGEVAGDIAFALRNIELEEERQRAEERAQRFLEQQIAVNQLALALGETRDLDNIYHTIYQHIQSLVDAWGFIVSSYDDETQLVRAEYATYKGTTMDVTGFPPIPLAEPGQGTQSQVIHTGRPLYASDHRKSREKGKTEYTVEKNGSIRKGPPSEEEREDSTNSAFYVPMKIEGQAIGVMQLQSPRLDAYTQEDIDLIAAMANVAAVAVQNARLYGAVQRELTERQRAEEALKEYWGDLQRRLLSPDDAARRRRDHQRVPGHHFLRGARCGQDRL
jgi:GAF domain-containing protein/HAMP domain-containing protein